MPLSYTSDLFESGSAFTFESNSWALDRKCLLTSIEFKFFPCAAPTTPMPQRILILYASKNIAEHLLHRKIVHAVRGKLCSKDRLTSFVNSKQMHLKILCSYVVMQTSLVVKKKLAVRKILLLSKGSLQISSNHE